MRRVVVLPALTFDDRHAKVVEGAVAAMRAIAPARVLITGLTAGSGCMGCVPSPCAACLPSEELHPRYRAFLDEVAELESRPAVGFVGMGTDGLAGCMCRLHAQTWLQDCGVDALPAVYELVPGWRVLGRPVQVCRRAERAPGQAAVAVARRLRASVIVGDTARLGVGRLKVVDRGGSEQVLTGFEVGCLRLDEGVTKIDRRKKTELGLGVVTLDGSVVVETRCVSI